MEKANVKKIDPGLHKFEFRGIARADQIHMGQDLESDILDVVPSA